MTAVSGVPPSSSLIRRLKEQDATAWQRFLQLYGPLVYSWCRTRWQLGPADAADVLQDVTLRVHEKLADFRGGSFVGWLWRITQSRAVRHRERNPTLGKSKGSGVFTDPVNR